MLQRHTSEEATMLLEYCHPTIGSWGRKTGSNKHCHYLTGERSRCDSTVWKMPRHRVGWRGGLQSFFCHQSHVTRTSAMAEGAMLTGGAAALS